ncbi:transposase [Weissella cibaria]|uniref:transposase n=1 Tax=Weissella cibaria TaxID=137591 RepID=UPI001CC3492C|nr:transposase [Weissella cibaria]MBZ6069154.1 transposase [Weissella cibaria]HJF38459.1 transposase [Weissella cibaria]
MDNSILYHVLNPLVAKKRLDDGSRMRKNDVRDARGLAMTEFTKEPVPYVPRFSDPLYRELSDMSRYYDQQTEDIKRERNRVHKLIQLTFPNFTDEIDVDNTSILEVLRLFPHPAMIKGQTITEITDTILGLGLRGIGQVRAHTLAERLWRAHSLSYPAVDSSSFVIKQLQQQVTHIIEMSKEREIVINSMIELAKQLPEYEILLSIPSVAENTAVRLIGERGDVRRFEKRSQINSFIGLDLTEIQSGDYVAQRHITKHGNPHARKLLYWTVINMVSSTAQPNHIRDSYEKKRATASRKKPLLVSSMDRLIKTIHYLINTNQFYSYELVHCKTLES